MLRLMIFLAFFLQVMPSKATTVPRGIGNENRIKIINYKPNTVFRFVGHYTYQSIIEFGLDEEIDTISMGTPTPWQIVPAGNRIFLKPVEDDATTNMTVITNKRMYFFEMHAEDATDIDDDNLSFVVKFVYPDDGIYSSFAVNSSNSGASQAIRTLSSYHGPDLTHPELYNFNYKISGKRSDIEPLQIFDDGEFTYFKFRNINAEIPAIFLVDSDNREGIINYRIAGKYVVVERVAAKFTLRHGKSTICVFNESYNSIDY
ncbi:MAG: P-type conjugative transfer protein VirB9 [Candidatus Midichloria sp.]|uniref:P-type conjugative transfer protein VirB9 n=1 Tax=Hyalomma marginatum TaxID=34627 RepID=A0A8S4C0P7_9ACAR|nr:P-type conjugative transfer protein VirB9 [Hyalomma marginatum]CAG7591149.1 P-type conjugative transfer protein VirB9 [Hyalomma marginatum]